ncbi:hypothetical protein FDH48_gp31 [Arthrobacter phage Jawnski]|uniref:Uncharacterized protein n=1 Tax=Arthrobacter phage Jawnski TaxID=1772327 RepID=A0A0U4JLX0_9CAUD|nr:hypothetical protein FDH48_gp31 [Arthrobacter phage Jawnski]ALY09361.1 hypothetical protein JAWNSKI_31 [Arthrobacter phage Jawnski]
MFYRFERPTTANTGENTLPKQPIVLTERGEYVKEILTALSLFAPVAAVAVGFVAFGGSPA